MSKYSFYPNTDNENFFKKISHKKEFYAHRYSKEITKRTPDELCNPIEFSLMPQQIFLKNFMSIETPYNSVLVFHGTGSGKTCTAVQIAENYKQQIDNRGKKILVLLQDNLINNFKRTIFNLDMHETKNREDRRVQCTGDTYALDNSNKYLSRDQKKRKIDKHIKEYYQFMGYRKFANFILRKTGWDGIKSHLDETKINLIKREFSNRIIIIDEVHNIKKNESDSDLKKTGPILETLIEIGQNNKLILMSATPMYDQPDEIVFILNLLRLNDNRSRVVRDEFFDKNGNLTEKGRKNLLEYSRGYVSYFRGQNPLTFPVKLYPTKASVPYFKYSYTGDKLTPEEQLKFTKLIRCPMSTEQYKAYLQVQSRNKENDIDMVMVSNFGVINKKGDAIYSSKLYATSQTNQAIFMKTTRTYGDKTRDQISYQEHFLCNPGSASESAPLDLKNLHLYSQKFKEIIESCISSTGPIFVYSRYIDAGILPLVLALEQNGFQRYKTEGTYDLLDYPRNSKGGGGKSPPIDYENGISITKFKNKNRNFIPAKYIMVSGSSGISASRAAEIISRDTNRNGQEVKVILGTRVLGEGIDFKGLRQIHIVEPWYNLSSQDQAIGRAIRNCSHIRLPVNERNVEVCLYASYPAKSCKKKECETETIDVKNYRLAENKDRKIKTVERVLKENAIDCALNYPLNVFPKGKKVKMKTASGQTLSVQFGDLPYSRECDYQKCEFKCGFDMPASGIANNKVNENTYSLRYIEQELTLVEQMIRKFYRHSYVFSRNDVIKLIHHQYPDLDKKYIAKKLVQMVQDQTIIRDKYDRKGYIIHKGKYYIFQPLDLSWEKIPLMYRKMPLTYKPKQISLKEFSNKLEKYYNSEASKPVSMEEITQEAEKIYNFKDKHRDNKLFIDKTLPEKYRKIILILYVVDRLTAGQKIEIIKEAIKQKFKPLLKHFDKYLIKENGKIVGAYIGNKWFCEDNDWKVCENPQAIAFSKLYKPPAKPKTSIYGVLSYEKNKTVLKLIDKTRSTGAKTIGKKESHRSDIKGQVCKTMTLSTLHRIAKDLKMFTTQNSKEGLCFQIEITMRYWDMIQYKGSQWII